MEQPRTRDKKKNTKTMRTALNIGAGAGSTFGIGGIVLLGGALVAATIVTVLASKRRKQHQSSSENINKDFSADFSLLENPSNDGVISMKEMETKTRQNLTKDDKHNSGIDNDKQVDSRDSNEDTIFPVVGEYHENPSVYVDSAFENREVDNSYEKVVLECEEQVVIETQIEEYSCLERDDGGEEQYYSMMINDEKDEIVDATLLLTAEVITSIEEYEAIEAPIRDDVAKASEKEEEEDQENVFMNEEAATEVACVNQVKVNDNSQEQFLEEEKEKEGHDETISENYVGDLSDETGYAEHVVHVMEEEAIDATCAHQTEVQNHPQGRLLDCHNEIILENYEGELSMRCSSKQVIEEEDATKAACVNLVDTEDILEMADNEFGLDAQEVQVNKNCETFEVPCTTYSLKEAVDDKIILREDNSPSHLKNTEKKSKETAAQKVEEQVSIEDDVVNKCDMLLPHAQLIEETKVDDQTVKIEDKPPGKLVNEEKEDVKAVQVEVEMITEDELVTKERISKEEENPHVKSIEEDVKVRSNKSSDALEDSSMTTEPKISNHYNEENMEENQKILGRVQNDSDQNGIIKDDKGSKSASNFLIELAKAKKQVLASEPWNRKLMAWSLLVSIWCLCHWYSELPYAELSLVGSLFFVLILLGYRNRTTYLV